jgi:hypothetical protein
MFESPDRNGGEYVYDLSGLSGEYATGQAAFRAIEESFREIGDETTSNRFTACGIIGEHSNKAL